MADRRMIRSKTPRNVRHSHPLNREGQVAIEKINGRLYQKIHLDGVWYRVPLLRSGELYPPEAEDIQTHHSDKTTWDDLRVSANAVRIQGVLNVPDWDNIGGGDLYALAFSSETMEQVFFTVQMPHSWREGTDLHPHVHWMPENDGAGDVRWGFEYEWVNIGDAYVSSTLLYSLDPAERTTLEHQLADFGDIDGTGKMFSSMLICRLFRDAAHEDDDYASDAYMLEFDFHYEIDSLGSRQEYVK